MLRAEGTRPEGKAGEVKEIGRQYNEEEQGRASTHQTQHNSDGSVTAQGATLSVQCLHCPAGNFALCYTDPQQPPHVLAHQSTTTTTHVMLHDGRCSMQQLFCCVQVQMCGGSKYRHSPVLLPLVLLQGGTIMRGRARKQHAAQRSSSNHRRQVL